MPALPDVPNVIRADFLFATSATTKAGMRTFYSYSGSAPSDATLDTIATSIEAAFASDLNSMLSNNYDLTEITLTDLTSPSSGRGTWSGSLNGGRAGAPPTIDTAVNLAFEIARRYRGGKPKIFLPFGITSDLNPDQVSWSNAFLGDVNGGWSSFDTAVLAITASGTTISQHVSISYYSGFTAAQNPVTGRWRNIPKLRAGGPLVDTVVNHSANRLVSQQRRRRTSIS